MKTGSTVIINVVVTNVSGDDILFETYYIGPNLEITDHVNIVDGNGRNASKTKLGRMALASNTTTTFTGKLVDILQKRNKSFTYQLHIGQLYDFNNPGKYTIQIERFEDDRKTLVKSNTITVTVTP